VEYQTDKVKVLEKKFSQGQVAKEELERQEGLLGKMTVSPLNRLHALLSSPLLTPRH